VTIRKGGKNKKIYIGFGYSSYSRRRWSGKRMAHLPIGEMELKGEEEIG
jgi:hypothetical protein